MLLLLLLLLLLVCTHSSIVGVIKRSPWIDAVPR
jgi:hypothetical protein